MCKISDAQQPIAASIDSTEMSRNIAASRPADLPQADADRSMGPSEKVSENGDYVVVDASSLNGTYVNRKPVESVPLANGDEIQMGKFGLVFLTGPTTH